MGRMRKLIRRRQGGEAGFTLIELLIVMLILGILAAIAIPAFLNQRNKASDSQAKSTARAVQTAIETCATDNRGSYSSCDLTVLRAIDPTIPAAGTLAAPGFLGTLYAVGGTSSTGNAFYIIRNADRTVIRVCTVPTGSDRGGCRAGDTW
jgi:type IV pilus assembly protein PilA